jgi:hypothetical protein
VADPVQQQIEVDLPKQVKAPAEKKPRTWPKDFDPLKPPPGGCEVHLAPEVWSAVHGDDPLASYALRGKKSPEVNANKRNELGTMGEIIRIEKGCTRCAARVLVVIPDGAKCVGCGTLTA